MAERTFIVAHYNHFSGLGGAVSLVVSVSAWTVTLELRLMTVEIFAAFMTYLKSPVGYLSYHGSSKNV